jgi:hypothetical protein
MWQAACVRERRLSAAGIVGLAWGLLGVCGLLTGSVARLSLVVADAFRVGLSPVAWIVLVAWVAFMGWSEGYRGFQRAFSPRVVARALHLAEHPTPLWVVLAPLYCMGLVHASRVRLVVAWVGVAGIVAIVIVVRTFSQPWRGIVDAGVVVGLGWGLVSILAFAVAAALGRPPRVDPGLPERERG